MTGGLLALGLILLALVLSLTSAHAASAPFLIGSQFGDPRNDATGWVGMSVTIGAGNVQVTHLGRLTLPGNSASHTVKIVRASTKTDLPGASVTVLSTTVTPGSFAYAELPIPVTLLAGQTYYIASDETSGGDSWYNVNTTVTSDPAGSVTSGIFNSPGFNWVPFGVNNQSYGPCNFKFVKAPLPPQPLSVAFSSISGDTDTTPSSIAFDVTAEPLVHTVELHQNGVLVAIDNSPPFKFNITGLPAGIYQFQARGIGPGGSSGLSAPYHAPAGRPGEAGFIWSVIPGPIRANFTGELGMRFTVGPEPLTLTALGRLFVNQNSATHRLRLLRASDQVVVENSTVQVNMAGGTIGVFQYATLPSPITLPSGMSYYLMSEEVTDGDKWYDSTGRVTPTDVATIDGPVFVGNGFPWTFVEAPGRAYVPVNFKHAAGGEPPPSINITSPANGSLHLLGSPVPVSAAADADVATVEFFANGTLIGTDNSSPFSISWTSPIPGAITLTARATDNQGIAGISTPVNITIETDEPPPTISLTQPAQNAVISIPATVTLQATTTGNPIRVDFFVNGSKIGEDTATPWQLAWSPTPGSHTLTATVLDTLGRTATSAPVNVTAQTDIGGGGGAHFVTGVTPGDPRNNFGAFLGMSLTIGPEPVDVTALGRLHIAGNTGNHLMKIVRAADGMDLPNTSVIVATAGGTPGVFQYTTFSELVTLQPHTRYYIVSQETAGGDAFLDVNTVLATTGIGIVHGGVYHLGGFNWQEGGDPGKCYGPVDFRYGGEIPPEPPTVSLTQPAPDTILTNPASIHLQAQVSIGVTNVEFFADNNRLGNSTGEPWEFEWIDPLPGLYDITARATAENGLTSTSAVVSLTLLSTLPPASDGIAFIRSVSGGTIRNDFGGFVGMHFLTGTNEVVVTALGRFALAGNNQMHTLKLVQQANGTDVPGASVTVDMSGAPPGVFRYAGLSLPVTLPPNTGFHLVSQETSGGDEWLDLDSTVTTAAIATIQGATYSSPNPPWSIIPGEDIFVPVSFRFRSDETELASVELTSPPDGTTLNAPQSVTLEAGASESIVRVEFFQGALKLGESLSRPFSLVWTNPPPGTHTLTVRGTDDEDQTVLSAPSSITILPGLPPGAEGPFILSTLLGRLRNDFEGFLGMTFTTGAEGTTITRLGRLKVDGNVQTHTVKLIRQSNATDVPGGSVEVSMAGATVGEFVYADLIEPIDLPPNTIYHLVSQERGGGDMWHDVSGTSALTSPVASLDSGVFGGPPWIGGGQPRETFVPVNFIYRAGEGSTNSGPLTVSLLSPSDGQQFTSPATITIEATASTGATRVEFFNGTTSLGEDTSFPFALTLPNLPPGGYALRARASNAAGDQADSPVANILVNAPPTGTAMPFITAVTPGDIRNDITGFLGLEFTVGPIPIVATRLGRYVLPGNSQNHVVKLATEADGADVPNGAVTVSTAGQTPGQFVYADLPAPITLQANTIYFIASEELAGGDNWYDVARTIVTANPVASVDAGVFKPGNWVTGGPPNHAYVPVNFQFISSGIPALPTITLTSPVDGSGLLAPATTLIETATSEGVSKVEFFEGINKLGEDLAPPFNFTWSKSTPGDYALTARATSSTGLMATSQVVTVSVITNLAGSNIPFITGRTPGSLRHNFTGWVGMKFTVGPNPVTITALGREYAPGNMQNHRVKLVRASDGLDLPNGSVDIPTSGGVIGQYLYASLPQQLILTPDTTYYVVSEETIDGDLWYDINTTVIHSGVATVDGGIHSSIAGWTLASGTGTSFGTVNFRYVSDSHQNPPTIVITSPAGGSTFTSPGNLLIEAATSSGVTNVEFFADSIKLADVPTPPFRFTWNNPPVGDHTLLARATDSNGLATAALISLTVEGPVPETPVNFVISTTLSPVLRNDFAGFLGMTLTTGPTPFTVTDVGRFAVEGNTGSHLVKFVRQSDGMDVPGASATVSMAGATPGGFVYAPLPAPVELAPNTIYHFVAEEQSGGDRWHDVAATLITTAAVAGVNSGVFSTGPVNYSGGGLPGHTYGPLDFKFLGGIPQPTLPLLRIERAGAEVRLILTGNTGSDYRVDKAASFDDWVELGVYPGTETGILVETLTPAAGTIFYRAAPMN